MHVLSVLFVFFLYIAIIAAACFENRSGVAHGIRVKAASGAGDTGLLLGRSLATPMR
jgi:hypothetical protein